MASADLAAVYAALVLVDGGIEITSDKIITLTNAANVELEPIWASLLAKALEGKNVKDLLLSIGSRGRAADAVDITPVVAADVATEIPQEEEKDDGGSDSGDDTLFGLFD